jgi:negative regulator of flagellin synthesis FlgM
MKIDNQDMLSSINAYQNDPVSRNDESGRQQEKVQAQPQDRVELSTQKTEIEKLKKSVESLPDVRSEKVAEIKQQIAEGSYRVDGVMVAQKMLEHFNGSDGTGGSK